MGNIRCTALSTDLDGAGGHRSQELTEALLEEFKESDSQVLWHNYGIDVNILVCYISHLGCRLLA